MPGKKGMKRSTPVTAIRRKIWRSIRIMRRFTQPDLMRTVPEATQHNVGKYVHLLERHGYIAKTGEYQTGRPGQYQAYQLSRNQVEPPNICSRCGQSLTEKECFDPKERKKEKEREEERNKDHPEVSHDAV